MGPGIKKKFNNKIKNIYFFKNNEKKLIVLTNKSEYIFTNGGNTMFEMLMRKKTCLIFPSNKVELKNAKFFKKKNFVKIFSENKNLKKQIDDLFNLEKFNYIKKNKFFNLLNIKKEFSKIFI